MVNDTTGHHHERSRRGRYSARSDPHGQHAFEHVEGFVVVAVKVGAGTGGARRDNVVVDGVRAAGILVADLDNHPAADGVREHHTVIRAYE